MRKLIFSLLPALALGLSLVLPAGLAPAEEMEGSAAKEEIIKIYEVGEKAPSFALPDGLTGDTVKLKDILNSGADLIALAFANTTCSACRAELTLLSSLAKTHQNLKVYMIAVDMRGEKLVKAYDANFHYKVQYLLDPAFTMPPVFGFTYTPALVLLDNDGNILFKKGGYDRNDIAALTKEVEKRL